MGGGGGGSVKETPTVMFINSTLLVYIQQHTLHMFHFITVYHFPGEPVKSEEEKEGKGQKEKLWLFSKIN